ncbi:sugar ABC transporter substrate-binding protein [Demequina lutea]|uniref:Multiple sugar transport system substrate-binding protein n=1 Tax=Demequina lutea TaxID=431489 RepID=A0A7Z0CJV0_9MICO|nr:extracellular solute-binding protein [Demequina lutea]NYI41162.1 multiple sugar transport system substrate-binding protein [Demequina lutea]
MSRLNTRRAVQLGALATSAVLVLAACSSNGSPAPAASGAASQGTVTATIKFWDPYPQREAGSDWDKLVKSCAPAGSTIERTSAPQTDLLNQLTSAVKEGNAPDVVLLDNPLMPDAASSGLLATAKQAGIDVSGIDANLEGPGLVDGVAYGVPMGSNALGLYYNKDVLTAAGVDVSTITNWDTLNAAIGKVVDSGAKGITFSGIAGEEGVFQFEPWFWGSGAKLSDIKSADAVSAGQLLSDWVGKGWAPKSAATDNQSASWDLFLTGAYGFGENGSWFASAAAANKGFSIGMIPIPAKDSAVAPVPTGGEFAVAPLQSSNASDHYANASAVISCLTSGANANVTSETLGYLSAKADVRAAQVAANPMWTPWVSIVEGAQGRTTDLGAGYVGVSAQLSQALQGALNAAGNADQVKSSFENASGL